MVTIGMNYKVLSGKEETFEKAFNKVVTAMCGIEGHSQTHMYRDINDPQCYLIVSEWTNKGEFDSFIASDTFRNVVNWGKEQILAGSIFQKITFGPGIDSVEDVFIGVVGGQDDKFYVLILLPYLGHGPNAVQFGHPKVHENHVRL